MVIHINKNAASWPIMAKAGAITPGQIPVTIAGAEFDVQFYFWEGVTNVALPENAMITFAAKVSKSDESFVFLTDEFVKGTDAIGVFYKAPLSLNTANLLAALANKESVDVFAEVRVNHTEPFQWKQTIKSQVITNEEPPLEILETYPQGWEVITRADIEDYKTWAEGKIADFDTSLDAFRSEVGINDAWQNGFTYPGIFGEFGSITQSPLLFTHTSQGAETVCAFRRLHPISKRVTISGQLGAISFANVSACEIKFVDALGNNLKVLKTIQTGDDYQAFTVTEDVPDSAFAIALTVHFTAAGSASLGFQMLEVKDIQTLTNVVYEGVMEISTSLNQAQTAAQNSANSAANSEHFVNVAQSFANEAGSARDAILALGKPLSVSTPQSLTYTEKQQALNNFWEKGTNPTRNVSFGAGGGLKLDDGGNTFDFNAYGCTASSTQGSVIVTSTQVTVREGLGEVALAPTGLTQNNSSTRVKSILSNDGLSLEDTNASTFARFDAYRTVHTSGEWSLDLNPMDGLYFTGGGASAMYGPTGAVVGDAILNSGGLEFINNAGVVWIDVSTSTEIHNIRADSIGFFRAPGITAPAPSASVTTLADVINLLKTLGFIAN